MPAADRILRCPLGPPTRTMQNCDFGRTLFKGMAEASPSKTALRDVISRECITYKSFISKAQLTARHLLRHGCRKGDVIVLFAPNSIDWLVVVAASFRIGLVPAGINSVLKAEEVNHQLILSGAKVLFTSFGQHLDIALRSLAGTNVHTLFCVGKNNKSGNGKDDDKENRRRNASWHDDDNENGKQRIINRNCNVTGSRKGNGYDDENVIGTGRERGIRKEQENRIGREYENGIGKESENGIRKEHEIRFGNELSNRLGKGSENGIGKAHGNQLGIGQEYTIGKDHGTRIGKEHANNIGKENANGIAKFDENGLRIVSENGTRIGHDSGIRIAMEHENVTEIDSEYRSDGHINCVRVESFLDCVQESLPVLPEFDELQLLPQDVAMVMLSSGTTGTPKAILLSHLNLQAQFIIASDERVMKVSDGQIVFAPFSHLGGGVMTLFALALGYTCHIMSGFQLEPYLKALSENKNESIAIVPAIALSLAKSPEVIIHDLSCLKEILCGTARLSGQMEQQLSKRFPGVSVRQGYGLTETTAICTCVPRRLPPEFARSKSGSIGVPLYNVEIKVVDPVSGVVLGPKQNGELLIRSPLVMKGYKGVSTSGVIDVEGWLHTGDLGCYDDDGYLWFSDRIKDLMRCASFQVSPSELESILLAHHEVADAVVFALHDKVSGDDLPAAWVVREEGGRVTEEELYLHVSGLVASYKRLCGGITFVERIPRTSNGKILRLKVQQLATALQPLT